MITYVNIKFISLNKVLSEMSIDLFRKRNEQNRIASLNAGSNQHIFLMSASSKNTTYLSTPEFNPSFTNIANNSWNIQANEFKSNSINANQLAAFYNSSSTREDFVVNKIQKFNAENIISTVTTYTPIAPTKLNLDNPIIAQQANIPPTELTELPTRVKAISKEEVAQITSAKRDDRDKKQTSLKDQQATEKSALRNDLESLDITKEDHLKYLSAEKLQAELKKELEEELLDSEEELENTTDTQSSALELSHKKLLERNEYYSNKNYLTTKSKLNAQKQGAFELLAHKKLDELFNQGQALELKNLLDEILETQKNFEAEYYNETINLEKLNILQHTTNVSAEKLFTHFCSLDPSVMQTFHDTKILEQVESFNQFAKEITLLRTLAIKNHSTKRLKTDLEEEKLPDSENNNDLRSDDFIATIRAQRKEKIAKEKAIASHKDLLDSENHDTDLRSDDFMTIHRLRNNEKIEKEKAIDAKKDSLSLIKLGINLKKVTTELAKEKPNEPEKTAVKKLIDYSTRLIEKLQNNTELTSNDESTIKEIINRDKIKLYNNTLKYTSKEFKLLEFSANEIKIAALYIKNNIDLNNLTNAQELFIKEEEKLLSNKEEFTNTEESLNTPSFSDILKNKFKNVNSDDNDDSDDEVENLTEKMAIEPIKVLSPAEKWALNQKNGIKVVISKAKDLTQITIKTIETTGRNIFNCIEKGDLHAKLNKVKAVEKVELNGLLTNMLNLTNNLKNDDDLSGNSSDFNDDDW